jgi:diadenosine tetraphosphatase ApaH/serine/threonine PP2A family protein phosphatase
MTKFAIFSDVHANLEALQAVLKDIESQNIENLIFLGDVVGYGANPAECLDLIGNLECPMLLGNHDAEVAGDHRLDAHRETVRLALEYSRGQLTREQRQFLGKLPLVAQMEDFILVHASLNEPEKWNYVDTIAETMAHFKEQKLIGCFHGHTHVPMVCELRTSHLTLYRDPKHVLTSSGQWLVNVGSVGQPRDKDPRACYVIYRPDQNTVEFRRVAYDIAVAQRKIRKAGLPEFFATRLEQGR